MTVRFDDSLVRLADLVAKRFGGELLARATIVRDAGGRLSVVLPDRVDSEAIASAELEIRDALGAYARPDSVVRDIEGPGARWLVEEAVKISPLDIGTFKVRLLDRRIVGADWLKPPERSAVDVPRIVFASLKGGVGRSTALCVLAAHLSRRGRRVLAIDFDLEAPGIGTLLLTERELPRFGTLDYLVENGLSGIDDAFMADLAGDSFLGAEGARVTVVPAIGRSTIDNPGDALGKIARAYLEDPRDDGPAVTLSEQLREMIERFESTEAYDVVLVDARAGLHETNAAAILGLGADILLFGIDHPQTFLGYRLLLAHLARFPVDPDDDWRDRLRFVHAKASDFPANRAVAEERFITLYDQIMPPLPESEEIMERFTAEDLDVGWDVSVDDSIDIEGFEPPQILHILDDTRYRDFNPVLDTVILTAQTYSTTFASLLEYADNLVDRPTPGEP